MQITLDTTQLSLGITTALAQASEAATRGEVPVGAAIIHQTRGLIASTGNRVEELHDATAHAETLAIRAASAALGGWRLEECALFVTLEPCTMCIGAIRNSRVGALVFGAHDARAGAAGSLYDLSLDERLGKVPRVISGIMAEECAALLIEFFAKRR